MKVAFKEALACGIGGLIGFLAVNKIYDKMTINLLKEENSQLKGLIEMYESDIEEHLKDIREINDSFDRILFGSNKEES